jgi:cytochrome bd ubiquinol oxidase subunit II
MIGLIWRGVAIEFRSKEPGTKWRLTWDFIYSFACIVIALSLGLMLGNVALGLPLNAQHEFTGNWLSFFNPFSVMVAVTTLALFMLHGAIYLTMKTENRLYTKLSLLAKSFTVFFLVAFGITTLYTLLYIPHLSDKIRSNPEYFILPLVMFLAIANIPRQLNKGKWRYAFISSSVTIAVLLTMVALEIFPNLLRATNDIHNSITVTNGASSLKTMKTLLLIAAIGTPLVGMYTFFVFWTFKGKVKLDETSY